MLLLSMYFCQKLHYIFFFIVLAICKISSTTSCVTVGGERLVGKMTCIDSSWLCKAQQAIPVKGRARSSYLMTCKRLNNNFFSRIKKLQLQANKDKYVKRPICRNSQIEALMVNGLTYYQKVSVYDEGIRLENRLSYKLSTLIVFST